MSTAMTIAKVLLAFAALLCCIVAGAQPPMVTKHLYHLAPSGGGGHPNDQQSFVDACDRCLAHFSIPDSAMATVVGTVFSGTVFIAGVFFVDDDVLFQNAQVFMEAGAQIVVLGGFTLDIEVSSFTACSGYMWKSITAQDGSLVRIRASFMDDAESTIEALDGSTVLVNATQFHNNRVGVSIPEVDGVAYNNVTLYYVNNTTYSSGPMRLPYLGQTSVVGSMGFAAFDVHKTTLNLTAGWNLCHHLSNGLVAHASNGTVYANTFADILPDAAYTELGQANGSAIYANGEDSFVTLKQSGHGNGAADMPSFSNCRWGLYTETMTVASWNNRMEGMGTAYRIDRSNQRQVDLHSNRVRCKYHGMDLRFNDGAASVLLDANDITFGMDEECVACRGYSAIRVIEANAANPSSVIRNNIIRFVPLPSSRFGISISSANDWHALGNQLIMASRFHSRTGIATNSCERVELSCNSVTSSDQDFAQYPVLGQAGIRNWLGADPLISCNTVDKTTNGILFSGWAFGTEVRGNEFHDHRWALHLEGDAIIGEQEQKGNLWFADAPGDGFQAIYEDSTNALLYRFKVNPANPPGGAVYLPNSVEPPTWFMNVPGVNYSCEEDLACDGLGERCTNCLGMLLEHIANDSLENDVYTPETRWIMKGDLYRLLNQEPELMDQDQVRSDFYADVENEVLAQLKDVDDEQLTLFGLDPAIADALALGRLQIDSLMQQLQADLNALNDENLTEAQRMALLASVAGLHTSIHAITAYHAAALQLAANSRVLTAESIAATNAGIAAGELIEANHKTVHDVYLNTLARDITEFTAAQADALFAVANQCPLTGGNAVFRARSLYSLIDDAQEYDDALLCLQQGLITKHLRDVVPNHCTVVPNPACDYATLVLLAPLAEPGLLVLSNALGAEVMRVRVSAEQQRLTFGIEGLATGLYHYSIRDERGDLGGGKLAIER
ncbi:MAG: right-handed parallel beta-helix repeat-containing protein [Flavobacteriales bacterium]|nr:right-handed parallel beta-helix repeat-containing protein [Flavobacteriales bacterium]